MLKFGKIGIALVKSDAIIFCLSIISFERMNTTDELLFPTVRVFGNTTANWTHNENETSSEGTNSLTIEMESLVSKAFKVLAYVVAITLSPHRQFHDYRFSLSELEQANANCK